MLWTLFVILLVLWLLGMVTSYTLGGFIHLLLIIAVVVVLIRIIQGRSPVAGSHTPRVWADWVVRRRRPCPHHQASLLRS